MEDKLHTLIAYFEEEKSKLLKLIQDCIIEEEYQLAHFHQRALYQLNRQLQTLRNIDDSLYHEKCSKQNWISFFEKKLKSEISDYMKEHLTKELLKHKEALNQLNQSSKKVITSDNNTILENCIIDLIEKKIKGFKLILKKSDNLLLEFNYQKKVMKATLPYIKGHIEKWILYEENINTFINLGFNLTDKESRLVLKLAGNKEAIISKLKIILSKIVFEIFYFKEFENESYIQIEPKAIR